MRTFQKLLSLFLVLCLMAALWTGMETATLAAEATEETPDVYVYYFDPDSAQIPEYYSFYAKPAVCNSPHYVMSHDNTTEDATYLLNLVNTSRLIWDQSQAPDEGYATLTGFCADRVTRTKSNTPYRKINLEDAFFCKTEDGTDSRPARGIRAVMRHTWPYIQDVDQIVAAANAFLTKRDGDEAVLVQDLTGAELLSASQAAVWHYSNNENFSHPYPYARTMDFDAWGEAFCAYYYPQMMYLDGFVNIHEKQRDVTASNITGIYEYLVSLPGEEAFERLITESSLKLAGAVCSGETMTLLVYIDGTVDSDDALLLWASCADASQSWSLGGNMEAQVLSDQVFAVHVDADKFRFGEPLELKLNGSQQVQDICFMEAKPLEGSTPRATSQNLAIYSNDAAPVAAAITTEIPESRKLEITKVDAGSNQPLPGVSFDLYVKLDGEAVKLTTLTTDDDGKIAVDVASDGNEYYFVESEPLPGYEAREETVSGGTVSNTMSTGSLTVSQKVINTTDAKPHEQFSFRLTLDPTTAPISKNGLSWLTEEYLSEQLESTRELDWTVTQDGTLTTEFTLKSDASITLSHIPLGVTYRLEEILTPKDRLVYSVTTRIGDGKEQKSDTAQGTIARHNAVLYTNTLHGEPNPQTGDALFPAALLLTALLPLALLFRRKPE